VLVGPPKIPMWTPTCRCEIPRLTRRKNRSLEHGRKWQLEEDNHPHRRRV
jgi:hypothetical protein